MPRLTHLPKRVPMRRVSSVCVSVFVVSCWAIACGSSAATSTAQTGSSVQDGGADPIETSSTPSSGTATGSVQGHSFAPKSVAFAYGAGNDNSLYVVLSSQAAYCDNLSKGVTNPNHTSLVVGLNTVSSSADAPRPQPGAFPIVTQAQQGAGNQAEGSFNVSNATCGNALSGDSTLTGGTVTLASVTSARVGGNYSVQVGSDSVSGSFDAVFCAGLQRQIASGAALACQSP